MDRRHLLQTLFHKCTQRTEPSEPEYLNMYTILRTKVLSNNKLYYEFAQEVLNEESNVVKSLSSEKNSADNITSYDKMFQKVLDAMKSEYEVRSIRRGVAATQSNLKDTRTQYLQKLHSFALEESEKLKAEMAKKIENQANKLKTSITTKKPGKSLKNSVNIIFLYDPLLYFYN
jgi:hypothetical protein